MLARLQQISTGLWLAGLLACLAALAYGDHARLAVIGLVALLVGHAVWLGLSFGLARWVNRADPAPAATWRQTLAAWWGEVQAAPRVFAWRQPFRAQAEPDRLPAQPDGRPGLLLVHGFVCNRGLWNPWLKRLREQGIPVVAISLEPVFGSIEHYVPQIEAAVLRLHAATGTAPVLVGHSMGGLAIRAWLRAHAADSRVRAVVTLGTPHQGTWLARWAFSANGMQMRQGSAWLAQLAADEPASRRRLFVCCFSHCDNIVFPASSACLPDARIRHVPATAHVDLIHHPGVMAVVLALLEGREDRLVDH